MSSKVKIYNEQFNCYYYEENPNVCYKIENDNDENDVVAIWFVYIILTVMTLFMIVILISLVYDQYMVIRMREIEFDTAKNGKEIKQMEMESTTKIYPFEDNSSKFKFYSKQQQSQSQQQQ
jgi:hypothetical protein